MTINQISPEKEKEGGVERVLPYEEELSDMRRRINLI